MLLPWSHDTGPLARRSWLTLALISACVVAFLAAGHDPAVAQFERTADEAHAYWQAHPYLEPGDLLAAHYGDDGAAARAEFRASLAAGDVPIPASVLDAEQDELDRLTIAASHALEQHVWYRYGLIPTAPRLEGLFGHLFLHGSWGHLLGNLLFLFLMAPFLEDRWGRTVFGLFYLSAGVAAAAAYALQSPHAVAPLIGASGAIAGAMGAFLVVFGTVRIRFAYWLGFFWGTFAAPAWLLLPLWFVHELATARLMDVTGTSDGIAYWAHVGGFVFGAAAAGVLRATGADARLAEAGGSTAGQPAASQAARRSPPTPVPEHDGEADLWEAVQADDRTTALRLWKSTRRAGREIELAPPEEVFKLAGWLRARAEDQEAVALLQALLPAADATLSGRIERMVASLDGEPAEPPALPTAEAPAPPVGPEPPSAPEPAAADEALSALDALEGLDTPAPPLAPAEPVAPSVEAELFDTEALDLGEKEEEAWEFDEGIGLDRPGGHAQDDDAAFFDTDALDLGEADDDFDD